MNYFKHEKAVIESRKIGSGSKFWAFAHVLPGAKIGKDCNICDHVFIENEVVIGDRVTIKSGVQLWDGITLEDDVFIGPNATFTNDLFPRSKQHPDHYVQTLIRQGASIGANATILAGNEIGKKAMVGAGAVVTKAVPPNAIVQGNPAQIVGYTNVRKISQHSPPRLPTEESISSLQHSLVPGVTIHHLPVIKDLRGSLSYAEYEQYLPFVVQRYFLVFDVKNREVRGEHAHKTLEQFLVCIQGSCSVVVDDGNNSEEIPLDSPAKAVYLPPLIWAVQYKYTQDAMLLVLASQKYDPADYIRDYDEFLAVARDR